MNALVPVLGTGQMPAAFQGRALPDMARAGQQGVQAGFAVIGYKGRNWRIKHRGDETLLMDARRAPIPVLEVVIVGVSPYVSKQWYGKAYSDGDDAAPDCFSLNGVTPDPTSPKLQSPSCASCPQNVYGSRVTENGKKAKACQDSRRIAVVPYGDVENETYGGPMLLRLPPMTLTGFAKFCGDVARFGGQPFAVRLALGFDYDVAYPLITFTPLGWLDDETAAKVADVMQDPLIERMLMIEAGETQDPAVDKAEASPLAQGAPPAALNQAPAVQQSASQAQAQQAAEAAHQQAMLDAMARSSQANGPVHPTLTPPAAPPPEDELTAMRRRLAELEAQQAPAPAAPNAPKKAGAFGAAPKGTTLAPAPVAAAAATAKVEVKEAPEDMEAAIDALLG